MRLTPPLNLPAPGRRQTLYVVFDFAESCVFSKQSPGAILCDRPRLQRQALTPQTAHLLPKLRCQFAEFLYRGSLKRLGILSPSTCVGLRYGQPKVSLEVFLGSVESASWFGRSRTSWPTLVYWSPDLPNDPPRQPPGISNRPYAYPSASPHRNNVSRPVQEC